MNYEYNSLFFFFFFLYIFSFSPLLERVCVYIIQDDDDEEKCLRSGINSSSLASIGARKDDAWFCFCFDGK